MGRVDDGVRHIRDGDGLARAGAGIGGRRAVVGHGEGARQRGGAIAEGRQGEGLQGHLLVRLEDELESGVGRVEVQLHGVAGHAGVLLGGRGHEGVLHLVGHQLGGGHREAEGAVDAVRGLGLRGAGGRVDGIEGVVAVVLPGQTGGLDAGEGALVFRSGDRGHGIVVPVRRIAEISARGIRAVDADPVAGHPIDGLDLLAVLGLHVAVDGTGFHAASAHAEHDLVTGHTGIVPAKRVLLVASRNQQGRSCEEEEKISCLHSYSSH